MDNSNNEIPKSRTSSLLFMATKIAVKEGKSWLESKADKKLLKMMAQADIMVNHVGQLKGAAMKAVQMISIEAQDLLPPEVLQILEKLQSQAPPLSNEVMKEALKAELGDELFLDIKELSKDPIASASIGQVYQAKIAGESVVIKIQYPGVADSVDSDLKVLKKLTQTLLFVSRKEINIDELFTELTRVLKMETDYLNEVKSLQQYGELLKNSTQYRIPKVYPKYCTNKIIVLSAEDGVELTEWIKSNPSMKQKEEIGQNLLNLYMEEFFTNHLVQTDPNPANFLVNKKNQLVLLDFGATVSYQKSFVKDYQSLLRAVFQESDPVILEKIAGLGFLSSKESDEVKTEFVEFMKLSLLPFDKDRQPFDFSTHEYPEQVRQGVFSFTRKLKYSPPPSQIIFLHRKLGGIFQLLRKLEVQIDLTTYRKKILNCELN